MDSRKPWAAAEEFHFRHLPIDKGLKEIIRIGRKLHSSPAWDVYEKLDFQSDLNGMLSWFTGVLDSSKSAPPTSTKILSFSLHDVPERFNLRGDSDWSPDCDEDEWWCSIPEYEFGWDDCYRSPILNQLMWGEEVEDDRDLYVVNEFSTAVAYTGLVAEHLFTAANPDLLLKDRDELWLAVGFGAAEYANVLGRRTRNEYMPQPK